jgi:hypothetical protein
MNRRNETGMLAIAVALFCTTAAAAPLVTYESLANVATIMANIAGLKRTIPLFRLRTRTQFKL